MFLTIIGKDLSDIHSFFSFVKFSQFRQWFDKFPFLVGNAVYCYLRLIADHISPTYETLRKKEIAFCVTLLREKVNFCRQNF